MASTAWLDEAPDAAWLDEAPEAPAPEMLPSHAPYSPLKPPREAVAGEKAPGFGRGAARGLWSLPGLVGLDYETAAAAEWAVRDPDKLGERGLGLRERFNYYQEKERERSRRGEAENPITTGLGIGVGATPSMFVMPQAKAAQGASLGVRALKSALTTGAQSAAIEGGVTAGLPAEERLKRMAVAGGAGGALGALAPMPSHSVVPPPEPAADWLAARAEGAAIRSTGADRTAIKRTLLREGGEKRAHEVGRFMLEEDLPLRSPAKLQEAAGAIRAEEGPAISSLTQAANKAGAVFDMTSVANRAQTEVLAPLLKNPFQRAAAEKLAAQLDELTAGGKVTWVTPSRGHELRMMVDEALRGVRGAQDPDSTVAKAALGDIRRIVSDELGESMKRAGLGSEWAKANQRFHRAADVQALSAIGAERRQGNAFLSPTEKGMGGIGAAMAAMGEPAGGAALAVGTIAAKRYGAPVAAHGLDKLATALRTNPEQFGANASALLGAAERGPEALAAAHYVLSLRSPEYRLRWNAAAQQEEHE